MSPLERALQAEGVTGTLADLARSIYQQESSSGRNTKTSNRGAVGGMQVIPATFQRVADPGWNIADPVQNARAGVRYLRMLHEQSGGDPKLTAAGYYGGEGAIPKARAGVAVRDPVNPNAPNTIQYGEQVAARLPMKIDPNTIKWDAPKIDPAQVKWDEPAPEPMRITVNGTAADERSPVQQIVDNPWTALEAPGAGLLKGMLSLPQSVGYLLPKALEFSTSLGGLADNPVSRFFGTSADTMSGANKSVNDAFRAAHGDSALATAGEIGGNIIGASGLPFVRGAEGASALWQAGGWANRLKSLLAATGVGAGQGVVLGTQTNADSPVKNALVGGAGGAAGQLVAGKIMDRIAAKTAGATAPGNILRDQASAAAREAGYTIPPSQTNPTLTNRILEGTAGKISTAQRASRANEGVTNELVAKALGTTPDNLTPEGLAAIRAQAGQAYEALKGVGTFTPDELFTAQVNALRAPNAALESVAPGMGNSSVDDLVASLTSVEGPRDASGVVTLLRKLRADASANLKNTMDPVKHGLGKAQKAAAKALEDAIDRELSASGRTDLLDAFRAARERIAKSYTVEKALGATGTVSAPKLGNLLAGGAPLTGELRTVAEVGRAFPKAVQSLGNQSVLPISPLDYAFGSGMAGMGYLSGNPMLAALALARPAIRSGILSAPYQQTMGVPSYAVSALTRALGGPALPLTSAPALTAGFAALNR